MKRLNNIDEYKSLTRRARLECKNSFSNNYFMSEDVQRYIEAGQAYYEDEGSGYILILDEENRYRVCLYVDVDCKFTIPQLDKKVIIKNVYRKGREEEALDAIEKRLEDLKYKKMGTDVQIKGEVQTLFEKSSRYEKYVKKMEAKGYYCVMADETYYHKIEEMVLDSKIIKDYQIDYRSLEEKKRLPKGAYLCVFNADKEMCAVSVCFIDNGVAYGEGVAVAEKFKMHGLAPILAYHRYKWLYDNGIKYMQGWILLGNEASLRYHESLGYKFVNKYVDEWISNDD